MAVVYGSPDLLPTLSVLYSCVCGRRVAEAGAHAGDPPPFWVRVGDDEYLCERCASQAARTTNRQTRDQAR
jgi:hypothetical protein